MPPEKDFINQNNVQMSISAMRVPYHTHNGQDSPLLGATGALVPATFENKRINPRWNSISTAASYVINTDAYDCFAFTALNETINTIQVSGTPVNFQKLLIRIKDAGTSETLDWSTSFSDYGGGLPTATVAGKTMTLGFIYDSVAALWGCVAYVHE